MDCATPQIFEIVAVGAIAIVLELRMPYFLTCSRNVFQSKVVVVFCSRYLPRASCNNLIESIGNMPLLHNEPSNDSYLPRSLANSIEASIA